LVNKRRKTMRDFNLDGVLRGRPSQAINKESAVQVYPIGTIYEAYGNRYRYCKAAAALTPGKRGCPTLVTPPWTGSDDGYGIGSDSATASGTAGENFLDIVSAAHLHTLDEFQDGVITLYPAAGIEIFNYRIIGSDLGSSTTAFRLYIDPPLKEAATLVPCDISPSVYSAVGAPASVGTYGTVVVVPEILVTSAYFFWGQTRGRCWVTPNAAINAASTRTVCFHTNGTIKAFAAGALQIAGNLLALNTSDDDAVIQLMLE
jgi:hypothetical protein